MQIVIIYATRNYIAYLMVGVVFTIINNLIISHQANKLYPYIKEPNEPMFTLTVTDRHGIVHRGRIRRLMPVECWKLQGFRKDQFEKVAATGMSDAQLYKQAGNSITVAVVEAIARNLLKFDEEVSSGKYD